MRVDSGEKIPTPKPALSTHAAHFSVATKLVHMNTGGMVDRTSFCQGFGPV